MTPTPLWRAAWTRRTLALSASLLAAFCPLVVSTSASAQQRAIEVVRTHEAVTVQQGSENAPVSLGTYHALLISVASYAPHHPDLTTPHADTAALRSVLEAHYCFEPGHVTVLQDRAASREGILDSLDAFANSLGADDNLLIVYAGHGTAQWRFEDWAEGFWVPHGATDKWSTWLSSHTLRRAIERIRARHVLVISDSCFSGSMNNRDVRVSAVPEDVRRFARDPSCQLLASGSWEPVADDGRDGHSIFAWHLLRILRQQPAPYFTARDLASEMIGEFRTLLRRREVQQMPEWDSELIRQGTSSGQFVFVRDPQAESAAASSGQDVKVAQAGVPAGWAVPSRVRIVATSATDDGATAVTPTNTNPRSISASSPDYVFIHDEAGMPVEMVLVAGGTYRIGTSTFEVEPFLIDRYEVTNARIANFKNLTRPEDWPRKEPIHGEPTRPATGISLQDARRFAGWAGKRIPTVTQWRFAAGGRGQDRATLRRFPWGDDPIESALTSLRRTGSKTPRHAPHAGSDPADVSRTFAFDLGRSVAEWCELDPPDDKRGVECGGRHVLSMDERMRGLRPPLPEVLRTVQRAAHERAFARLGFRCVLPLVPRRR